MSAKLDNRRPGLFAFCLFYGLLERSHIIAVAIDDGVMRSLFRLVRVGISLHDGAAGCRPVRTDAGRTLCGVALADQATVGTNNLFEKDMIAIKATERVAITVAMPEAFAVLKTAAS